MIYLCPECGQEIEISDEQVIFMIGGELYSCPCCGTEIIFEKGNLVVLQIEGEDWGE